MHVSYLFPVGAWSLAVSSFFLSLVNDVSVSFVCLKEDFFPVKSLQLLPLGVLFVIFFLSIFGSGTEHNL